MNKQQKFSLHIDFLATRYQRSICTCQGSVISESGGVFTRMKVIDVRTGSIQMASSKMRFISIPDRLAIARHTFVVSAQPSLCMT